MTGGVWVSAVGLNPLRIVRITAAVDPDVVLAVTTPQTAYVVPQLARAMAHMNLSGELRGVAGDAYRWDITYQALLEAVEEFADSDLRVNWVIGGGTKPMLAAQVAAARHFDERARAAGNSDSVHIWSLDDRRGRLTDEHGNRVDLADPIRNISATDLARLHAGMDAQASPDFLAPASARDVSTHRIKARLQKWRSNGYKPTSAKQSHQLNLEAEADAIALIRAILPESYSVHGSLTIPLRDPENPLTLAVDPMATRSKHPNDAKSHARRFEVDGLVVRGLRSWVLEYKNFSPSLKIARIDAAEMDVRRRDLAGDGAIGVMMILDDEIGRRLSADVDEFELGSVRFITKTDLMQAAECVINGRPGDAHMLNVFH